SDEVREPVTNYKLYLLIYETKNHSSSNILLSIHLVSNSRIFYFSCFQPDWYAYWNIPCFQHLCLILNDYKGGGALYKQHPSSELHDGFFFLRIIHDSIRDHI
ncbi:MAG TPA: hypothetical protein VNW99_13680, partial [Cytophagaceae bacterium]|nr:hypothetical protein [Cytophagaceae bacterium]